MQNASEHLSGVSIVDTPMLSSTERKPVVAVVATSTACGMTQNKWLALTPMFTAAGYEAVTLAWDDEITKVAATRQSPVLRAILQETDFDKLAEAKKVHALLDRRIALVPGNAPTWAISWPSMTSLVHRSGSKYPAWVPSGRTCSSLLFLARSPPRARTSK